MDMTTPWTEEARELVEQWNTGGGYLKTTLAPAILADLAQRIAAFAAGVEAATREQVTGEIRRLVNTRSLAFDEKERAAVEMLLNAVTGEKRALGPT